MPFKLFDKSKTEEIESLNKQLKILQGTVEHQRRTIITHEHHITDLSNQNEVYRKSRIITPQEEETFKFQTQHTIELQKQLDRLALWLRINKSEEITQGKHSGRGLINVILFYLGGEAPAESTPATQEGPNGPQRTN